MTDPMTAEVYDAHLCALGEGPLWHPERGQLFWFDILRYRLHAHEAGLTRTWQFDEHVSAAGWIDAERLLIASETALFTFDIGSGTSERLAALEADRPDTRSNDGRADPWGGFWIGTMSKTAAEGQGTIYRYYKGELRVLFPGITIPNAIAFTPDGQTASFADTTRRMVWRVGLGAADGWPDSEPEVFLDHSQTGVHPDGAVFDADGDFWCAEWGGARVARYGADGVLKAEVSIATSHVTCPAFGGDGLTTLHCTTARQGLTAETLADGRPHGATFAVETRTRGQAEHRIAL